jgi:hypothetical protein
MANFEAEMQELTDAIKASYETSVTVSEAEVLAARFLYAQISLAQELEKVDLDCRMKKTGLKAIKAAVYLEEAAKGEKKPSDAFLQAKVDLNEIVTNETKSFDEAEVYREKLENYMNIVKEAHIFYRGIAKQGGGS